MRQNIDFEWIKSHYFSNEAKQLNLKKGEVLLNYSQVNSKLFLVLKGSFLGFLREAELENYPIFEASKNKFIGVYSYFSDENKSYSKVIAMEDSVVAYYDKALLDHDDKELEKLMPFLMSVVVNELYSRQHFAKKMAKEKQADVARLLKAEKMATLGQMAAGLAHELNNSVGVIGTNLDIIEDYIQEAIKKNRDTSLYNFFNQGLVNGQNLSSTEARKHRHSFQKQFKGLSERQTKKLSKTGIELNALIDYIGEDPFKADLAIENWELGCTLHNMRIAANHSNHVVKSVKSLGVAEHHWAENVDVNQTINEALVIVQNLTKRVNTTISLGELGLTSACAGELVQVWINIIKNAVESMVQSNTENPKLEVISMATDEMIEIDVSDNGPGIPKKIISKVFEPSFTTKVGGLSFGLGLGLSIVQRIISEHDGTIEVSSIPGKTVFKIKLPLIS